MKTAEEWLSPVADVMRHLNPLQWVKDIQSDAYAAGRRDGMTEAANECYLINIHGTAKIMNGSCDEIKKRILTAIDKEAKT